MGATSINTNRESSARRPVVKLMSLFRLAFMSCMSLVLNAESIGFARSDYSDPFDFLTIGKSRLVNEVERASQGAALGGSPASTRRDRAPMSRESAPWSTVNNCTQ